MSVQAIRNPAQQYGVADVERLLRIPRRTLRALVGAGFVTPTRGPRNAWLFSFQDLIVLRTARALVDANLTPRRIAQSLKALRRRLPESVPLSGLRIRAVGDRVVVSERGGRWQADSGQYLLAFEGDPVEGMLGVIDAASVPVKPAPARKTENADSFERAIDLEPHDSDAARKAYEQAIALEPTRIDAHINLGRLLHEAGRHAQAERVYREALRLGARDPLLNFNLGVLLEDMGRKADAMRAYEAALSDDPNLADGHYNLALLYESMGRAKDAIRHLARYRRLTHPPRG
jgi:tetratricopeptide (TPR) repeat protein